MSLRLEEGLVALALRKPVVERAAFLERECGGDTALRQRIEELLAADKGPGSSLEAPTESSSGTTVLLSLRKGRALSLGATGSR